MGERSGCWHGIACDRNDGDCTSDKDNHRMTINVGSMSFSSYIAEVFLQCDELNEVVLYVKELQNGRINVLVNGKPAEDKHGKLVKETKAGKHEMIIKVKSPKARFQVVLADAV